MFARSCFASLIHRLCAASSFQLFNAGPGPLSFSVDPSSRTVSASLGADQDVQWGTVTPVFGSIPAQQAVTFTLMASSLLLPPGSFGTTIVIHTNQPTVTQSESVSDQPISLGDGQAFAVSWSLQIVEAIAFPSQINVTLSPFQAPVDATVSVANFAGAVLVMTASSNVSWIITDRPVDVVSAGSVASFPVAISYPVGDDVGGFVRPGTNLSADITVECWRADASAVGDATVTPLQLAALVNRSVGNLPNSPFFSPISLNAVGVTVSTIVGPPNATLSTVQLLSAASIPVNVGAGIRISLHMRDAGGNTVQPTDDVIGLVGLEFLLLDSHYVADLSLNSSSLASVTGIVPSADNSSFIINAQPLVLGSLLLNVTLNGLLVGSPISVTVFTANCGTNQTAVNGLTCACRAGYYFHDSTHCLPCPAGSYKSSPSNEEQTS